MGLALVPIARIDVEKARRESLDAVQRRIDAAAKPFAAALAAWLRRFARAETARALRDPRAYAGPVVSVAKARAPTEDELRAELERLLRMFGLRAAGDAANRTAGEVVIPASLYRDAVSTKDVRIKWFWELERELTRKVDDILESTKAAARDSVKRILVDASREKVQPSTGEIARRIRTSFSGPGDTERPHRVHATEGERAFAFSSERAALIARTETVQAENTGIFGGYVATGVEEVEWLAYSDMRSGDRHHERMKGERVAVGEYFTLPSGAKLRYPGDPLGPIGETANCRCSLRAVRAKATKPKTAPARAIAAQPETQRPIDRIEAPRTRPVEVPKQAEIEAEPIAVERAQSIVGRRITPEQIAALSGFSGARVTIDYDDRNESILISAGRSFGDEKGSARRQLYRDRGALVMYNESFILPKSGQGSGEGSRAFAQQVALAASLGVDQIRTEAARGPNLNGYYTWARLGYDAELPEWAQRETGLRMISELMATPEGRAWWREHGQTFAGTFDLAPGSQSRRILDEYLRERFGKAREQAPDIDEQEQRLDAAWDEVGRERGIPPPLVTLTGDALETAWGFFLAGRYRGASEAWLAGLRRRAERAGLVTPSR